MRLRSLLDLDLPPLVDAERLLAELRDQRTWRLAGAVALMALAVVAVVALPQVWLVPAAGAIAALATAAIAFDRRRSLLEALVQVRDA
jgi:CHASE2 domain-containing sensor protein